MPTGKPGKAMVSTIGCRLNQTDTALIHDHLIRAGFEIVSPRYQGNDVVLIIVNTCAVTNTADRKSRQALRSMRAGHPKAFIAVTGCAARIAPKTWQTEAALDSVIPGSDKNALMTAVARHFDLNDSNISPPPSDTALFAENAIGRHPFKSRAFIKIQEGCECFCSYCIVPYARGPERSRRFTEIIDEAKKQLEAGFHELVLTGVNTCAYRDGARRLPDLAAALAALPGEFRLRFSSTEPEPMIGDLVGLMANSNGKICRFLHLPLQYGANSVLKRMNRRYTLTQYENWALTAKTTVPDLHLGTDLIVGFPGETDAEFKECLETIRRIGYANTHVFSYSRREGTPAANYADQVPNQTARQRHRRMAAIGDEMAADFAAGMRGKTLPVLIEKTDRNGCEGWSDNYLRVATAAPGLKPGMLVNVKINHIAKTSLSGAAATTRK